HSLHAGVISPGFPQAVSTVIASQPNSTTDRNNELPGLSTLDGFGVDIHLGIEEDKVLRVLDNIRVSLQIFPQGFPDTIINIDLVPFSPLLLLDPKPSLWSAAFIDEMSDLKLQQIRNAQSGIDSHRKQQKIAKTQLPTQLVFDLSNLFPIANGFYKIHKTM
ncbi:MAG: hypothetical protein WBG94_10875, partial [Anaerolineales bacterium]